MAAPARVQLRAGRAELLALLLLPLACALAALAIGQDANYDLLNYHFYDPYAFLHGRLAIDVIPASLQSYLNPLVDLPFYFLITHVSPRWEASIVGGVQGLNLVLVYLIARRLARSRVLAVASTVAAGVAGGFASELGNSMGDTIVSIPMLAAVLAALVAIERSHPNGGTRTSIDGPGPVSGRARRVGPETRWWAAAGLLAGIGAGLKLSELATDIAVVVGAACVSGPLRAHLRRLVATGAGNLAGLLLTGGYWTIHLWLTYGDPLIFDGSRYGLFPTRYLPPFVPPGPGFSPPTFIDAIFFPIYWLVHPLAVAEIPIRELSIPIAYILVMTVVLTAPVAALLARKRCAIHSHEATGSAIGTQSDRFLFVVFGVSMAIWEKQLGVYRYLIPVELIAPLVVLSAGRRLTALLPHHVHHDRRAPRTLAAAFVAICVLCAATASPASYWLRVPFAKRFFHVPLPSLLANRRTDAVLQVSVQPLAFIYPLLPSRIIAVGSIGNVVEPTYVALVHRAVARANAAGGGIFIDFIGSYGPGIEVPPNTMPYLAEIGLSRYAPTACVIDHASIGAEEQDITFCRLSHT